MTSTLLLCPGKKAEHPLFPVWKIECISCARRMFYLKETDLKIQPWTGHGPCPDKVEIKNETSVD